MNNEAFERAKSAYGTGAYDDATMEFIFPQLRESEDEKIRKEIIEVLRFVPSSIWEQAKTNYERCFAYLEKQKEQKPIAESKRLANEVIEYLAMCGYSPVLKDDSKKEHFHIDIPRHEDDFWHSEEYKHCRSVLGEYYMEGDYGCDTYTLYIWREKKEKKPAELTPLADLLSNYLKNDFEYFATAKWDEKKWNEVMNIQASELLRVAQNELKKEQKPAEWSEEDKLMIKCCLKALEYYKYTWKRGQFMPARFDIGGYLVSAEKVENWLKSLRPVSKESLQSWKPTEEQMKALNAINCHGDLSYVGQQSQLISLYNDLKKL